MTPLQKVIRNQAIRALNHVWIADGKMLDGLTHTGIYDRHYPVPSGVRNKEAWQLEVAEEVTRIIAYRPVSWSVWYGVFQSDGTRSWVTHDVKTFPPKASNALGDDVHDLLEKLVESRNSKHVVSWGWIASPKKDVDLQASHEEIIEKFTDWGAFDQSICNLAHHNRALSKGAA